MVRRDTNMENIWLKRNCKLATFWKLVFLLMQLQSLDCKEIGENEYHESKNCTLKPASEKIVLNLEERISDHNRLIQLSITVEWTNSTANDEYLSTKEWFMTTSVSGHHLLLLPDHFSEMSLGTLSYGIADVQITLKQEPEDCLANFTLDEAEHLLKYVLLTLPNNPEAKNELQDGMSKLHICNGTRDSNGECCALTLNENDVICEALEHDQWSKAIEWMIKALTIILLFQSVSFIPKDVYKKSENENFTLSDTTVNMHLQVTDYCSDSTKRTWDKVLLNSDDILRRFCEKLNEHLDEPAPGDNFILRVKINTIKSIVEKRQLRTESFPSLGILMFLYVSFRDFFLLRKSSGRCCHNCVSHLSCAWLLVYVMIYTLPYMLLLGLFIIRIRFLAEYEGKQVSLFIYMLFMLALLLIFYYMCLHFELNVFQDIKMVLVKCLRITFETDSITKNKYKEYPISFFIDFVIYVKSYFPLLQFSSLVLSYVWHSKMLFFFKYVLYAVVLNFLIIVFYLVIDCVFFYVKCLFLFMLGLLLNYDKVVQDVLLLMIVVKYAYDTISDVQSKIRKLTTRVFKNLRELCPDTNSAVLIQGNDDNRKLSRFALCKCGSLCWLPRGVILFDTLTNPENIKFKNLSKKFIDDISSLPGHLTPGSRYSLLFQSVKEIASVIVILFLVLILVLGFGNVNDLSSSVLTIVTFATGTVSSILAKLWFKDTEYVVDGNFYLSKLIIDHLAEYEEPWKIEDLNFDIMACEQITNDDNIDIIVERRDRMINVCYLKPLVQTNTSACEAAKIQLKGMFIGSFEEDEEETSTCGCLASSARLETVPSTSRGVATDTEHETDSRESLV